MMLLMLYARSSDVNGLPVLLQVVDRHSEDRQTTLRARSNVPHPNATRSRPIMVCLSIGEIASITSEPTLAGQNLPWRVQRVACILHMKTAPPLHFHQPFRCSTPSTLQAGRLSSQPHQSTIKQYKNRANVKGHPEPIYLCSHP